MSKRIKLTDSELANLNNQLIRARMGRMRSIVLNEPPSIDGGGGSDDAGGGDGVLFGNEVLLWGNEELTFND